MAARAIAAALGLTVLGQAAHAQSCQLVSLGELKIVGQVGVVLIDAIRDGKPSGIGISIDVPWGRISLSRVRKLDLTITRSNIVLKGGPDTNNEVVNLGDVQLGAARLSGVQAFVENRDFGDTDLILGSGLLRKFLPEFDIAHGVLRLFNKEHCPEQVVYWAPDYLKLPFKEVGNRLGAPATINGTKIFAMISPGLPRSALYPHQQKELGITPQSDTTILDTLEIGGVTLHNLTVDAPSRFGEIFQIGDDVLKHMRFIIDYDAKAIYFTVG